MRREPLRRTKGLSTKKPDRKATGGLKKKATSTAKRKVVNSERAPTTKKITRKSTSGGVNTVGRSKKKMNKSGADSRSEKSSAMARRRPPAKSNSSMIAVVAVAGVIILIAILAIVFNESGPTQYRYTDEFSRVSESVKKKYMALDDGYYNFKKMTDGSSAKNKEASRLKSAYQDILIEITNFIESGSASVNQKEEARSWIEEAKKTKRQLGTYLFKHS